MAEIHVDCILLLKSSSTNVAPERANHVSLHFNRIHSLEEMGEQSGWFTYNLPQQIKQWYLLLRSRDLVCTTIGSYSAATVRTIRDESSDGGLDTSLT